MHIIECTKQLSTASVVFRRISTKLNGMQIYHTLVYFYKQVHKLDLFLL